MAASTPSMRPNNLLTLASQDRLCKVRTAPPSTYAPRGLNEVMAAYLFIPRQAFGIKITTDITIVSIAATAGYDCLFIDLEHTTLSLRDASQLCLAALPLGITPFVRVPFQCGRGFVQRVLDMGAMGVIFPHVHSVGE